MDGNIVNTQETKKLIIKMIKCYCDKDYDKINIIINSSKIDWMFFLEQIVKNKLENLAWFTLSKCKDFEERVPFYIREFISKLYYINKEHLCIYYKYFENIHKVLSENSINYAVVKGISLECDIYKNDYIKRICDVDMLIHKNDSTNISDVFRDNNILPGRYEYVTNKVDEFPREKLMFYKLTGDHLPEHFLFTREKICPFLKVDISTSFDWISKKDNLMMKIFLEEYITQKDICNRYSINTLKPEAHFIYLLNHFHRHAWSYRFINRNIGVRLCMTNDIYMYWIKYKKEIKEGITKLVKEKTEKEKIAWCLYYIDELYGTDILKELQLQNYLSYLNCAFGKGEELMKWDGKLEDRIWARNEMELFSVNRCDLSDYSERRK